MISAIPLPQYCEHLQELKRLPQGQIKSCLASYGRILIDTSSYKNQSFLSLNFYSNEHHSILEYMPMGGSAALMHLRLLHFLGLQKLITVGFAGAVSPSLEIGQKVSVSECFGFDGTSDKVVSAKCLQLEGVKAVRNFTTEHPFDEGFKPEVFRQQQVETVDMEAISLASFGQRAGIETSLLFVISDLLRDSWTPGFQEAQKSLKAAQELAISQL